MNYKQIILGLALAAVAQTVCAGPVARWLETVHDFGAFDENMGVVTCKFRAVNDGDEPLVIINARANCGCTRPSYSTDPVAPGDTLTVTVGYDPNGRPGRFSKFVRVETNSVPAKAEFKITGSVIAATNTLRSRYPVDLGEVKLRDRIIAYGQTAKGATAGAYLEGYNASHDTIHPRVDRLPAYLSARVDPPAVPPGQQFVITTVAYSDRTRDWGILTNDFDFYPTANATDPEKIETVIIIKEDFSKLTPTQLRDAPVIKFEPEKVDLGTIDRNKTTDASFEIVNAGKDPLVIRSIKCVDKAVTIEPLKPDTKIKSGKRQKVKFTVDPTQLGNRAIINARIIITANDPTDPSTTVRVVGHISR